MPGTGTTGLPREAPRHLGRHGPQRSTFSSPTNPAFFSNSTRLTGTSATWTGESAAYPVSPSLPASDALPGRFPSVFPTGHSSLPPHTTLGRPARGLAPSDNLTSLWDLTRPPAPSTTAPLPKSKTPSRGRAHVLPSSSRNPCTSCPVLRGHHVGSGSWTWPPTPGQTALFRVLCVNGSDHVGKAETICSETSMLHNYKGEIQKALR